MMDDTHAKLTAILNALPLLEGQQQHVELAAGRLLADSAFFAADDIPSRSSTTRAQTEAELEQLVELSRRLLLHINSMHRPALDTMKGHIEKTYPVPVPHQFEVWREMLAGRQAVSFPFDSPLLLARELSRFAAAALRGNDALKPSPLKVLRSRTPDLPLLAHLTGRNTKRQR